METITDTIIEINKKEDKKEDKTIINHIPQIIKSSLQTKNWRKSQLWYVNSKKNECELFQRKIIESIINIPCSKTNDRLYMETSIIVSLLHPLKQSNGFEYTENFDGKIKINNNIVYFNLKFVCDTGGAQTRSLREVYHFIKHMILYLKKSNNLTTYFINILDGNFCNKHYDKYKYLEEVFKDDIELIKKYLFIGDLYMFQSWWKQKDIN
jgi:hypothetical protein